MKLVVCGDEPKYETPFEDCYNAVDHCDSDCGFAGYEYPSVPNYCNDFTEDANNFMAAEAV